MVDSTMPGPGDAHDTAWYAHALDEAADTDSRYAMSTSLREKFGYHVFQNVPDDAPRLVAAVCWVVDYATEISDRNAKLVPRHLFGDRTEPPHVRNVDESIKGAWRDLFALAKSPAARSRLAHLLFQLGGAGGREMAAVAVDTYVQSAAIWQRRTDAIEDLKVASRVARAVNDDEGATAAVDLLLDNVGMLLEADNPNLTGGVVIHALRHATAEAEPSTRLGAVLEQAAEALTFPDERDEVLQLILSRCVDDAGRQQLWRRRVDAYLTSADDAESEIMRILLREKAVQIADKSGIKEVRERAASVLQTARDRDLEVIRVESSSNLYDELFEEMRDRFIAGDTWERALMSFAACGPLNGNTARNRDIVHEHHNLAPLTALFPAIVFGPGNLPYFRATTPDEKFEYDLTKLEAQIIAGMLGPLIAALHEIPRRFGLPTTQQMAEFLATWPGIHRSALPSVVLALQRFWVGDTPGAIHTLVPKIETLIRELLLRIDYGMYALEQSHRPGQYPALGFLIDALAGRFNISESGVRFLKVVLNEPPGLNIRNQFAHGIVEYGDAGTAALIIHTALFVGILSPVEPAAAEDDTAQTPDPLNPS
ncbi:hypothetical protein FZI85_16110 [Mycobacterium sp. CBMA293]|uniref:DUF4209 domain-containing protein n=2 Tax=Mycolicibacterium TaxID=1866885 RepID=UPI0012DD16EC|nr:MULTISPECIES: DUF4209 domain-containing protein [unclassified Mycolicibacterium]MUL46929.1 hypothetical protein [Mycolicibacterium sp. CBMA 360]MUL57284.1 hypothetical protein [Mycolicibacterium sp. CBMA 335]MUL70324.1 hypothetical protein [Mycolicibacterium sp. CBMA 311]MUL92372.1 hypothetical protein [Mycolicibacterium sp. CBMA 230]MUM06792.1 hypothetical protein [Mycolicibacterium sp. CBMA 213]